MRDPAQAWLRKSRASALMVSMAGAVALDGCAPPSVPGDRALTRPAQVVQRVTQSAGNTEPPKVAFDTVERIDAPIGSAFLIPLDPAMVRAAPRTPRVLLDDGLELPATLHAVTLHNVTGSSADSWSWWLGPTYEWKSRAVTIEEARALAHRADAGAVGFALLVEPKSGRADNACWLMEQRVPMQWLPSIDTLALRAPTVATGPWGPTLPQQVRDHRPLRALIERERANPLTRWRARLLEDGLSPSVRSSPFDDPVLEALASQHEHRWRVALARLWMASPDLCERVKKRLSAVVPVGEGVGVPMWETRPQVLDRLLLDLTNAHFSDARRAQLAEQWLAGQPQAVAWVLDDAGTLAQARQGAPPRALASVAVVNLGERSRLVWVAPSRGAIPGNPDPIDPLTANVQLVNAPPASRRGLFDSDSGPVVHVGEWSRPLDIFPAPLAVVPPGLRTDLFEADHSMLTLLSGMPAVPEEAWSTAALLHKPSQQGETDARPRSRGWELYVECRTPAGRDADARESLTIYSGPREKPFAAWRVTPDGKVRGVRAEDRAVSEELGEAVIESSLVRITRATDRWIARVTLPPGSIEEGELVRLSLVREDSRGVRQAWPRAMTPWSSTPSRALLDLRAWDATPESESSEP